ncbi:MAG TPA: DUF2341 domain-containing protein [Verrucomicrobiae bacterium]|jgi:hypothetical protein|nr:DUF2341 domain-containing protein [Verrucomicrobiae bacterium]
MKKRATIPGILGALLLITGAAAQGQSAYTNAVISLNPVAYWPLTETTPPPASGMYIATNLGSAQAAGNGYYETWWTNASSSFVLTNVNNIVHAPGALASDSDAAMQCGGAGQYLVLPRSTNGVYNPAVTLQPPFSVELWVYIHSTNTIREFFTEGGNNIEDPAFTNAIGQEGVEVGFNLNHFYFKTYNGPGGTSGGSSLAGPANPTTFSNTWHHAVFTFDGTIKNIYDNGVLVKSATLTSKNPLGQVFTTDLVSPLVIGNGNVPGGGSSAVFDGKIDEFTIYPTVLDATTIANHYAAGTNPAPATSYVNTVLADSPTIYLRLDEPDFTGPGLDGLPVATNYGTLGASANGLYQSGTAPGAAGPAYSGFGSSSYAVALNGFNGGVDVGGGSLPAALNPTGKQPLTIMTWFRGNPADAGPRIQDLVSHGTNSYRLGLDAVPGNNFNPGAGPQLAFTNNADMQGQGMDLNDGQWHFAAGVSDGTNDSFYLDGLLVKSGVSVANIPGNARDLILGGDPYFLGPLPSAAAGSRGSLFYDGSIAHVAYFTNALSAAQIQQLYAAAGVPPVIHRQPAPANLVVAGGTNVTYLTVVSGSSPVSYQWYTTNNTIVTGQTNSSLVFSNVLDGNSGGYYLIATNVYGSVTSAVVNLTVFGPPVITASAPSDIQVFGGSSPTLNLTALGSPPFAYQWTSNGVSIPDATNSGYSVNTSIGQPGAVTYIGAISNSFGAAFVTNVVTVLGVPTAPYPQTVLADGPVAFFRLNELSGTTAYDYVGGNNATYTNVLLAQTGYSSQEPGEVAPEFGDFPPNNDYAGNVPPYLTFATNSGNAEFSVEAWVTQYFSSGGGDGIVTLGYGNADQFILDTGATGGDLRFGVRNAANVSFLANSAVSIAQDGLWHHVVGVCDEAGGHLYLYMDGVQIASGTITPGSGILPATAPLSIGARESANNNPVNYDFQFIGKIDDVALYNQALSPTQVRNHFFASGATPIITQIQPFNQSVNENASATFTVTASGSPPLTYQWFDNNGSPITWGTNASLTITNVQTTQAGNYSVTVSDPYGPATTNASLTVNTGMPVISVDLQPTNVICYAGSLNTFSVTVSGSEPFFYQWYLNNAMISGATNASYAFAALAGTNTYFVTVTNSSGSALSSTATVAAVQATLINPSDYTSNLKITFSGYSQAGTLTNFPVLVRLSPNIPGFSYAQFASPNGADLEFTASTNLQALPYEIEQWNPAGESIIWVQVPLISGPNDFITAYWGNPGQTDAAASNTNGAVWKGAFSTNPEFDLVWHLNQSDFPFVDSTLQHPALTGVAPTPAAGIAGAGAGYNGSTTYLDGGEVDLTNSFTLSAWINISPSVPNIQTIWASKPGSGTANGFAMNVNNFNTTDGALRFITGNGSSSLATTSAGGSVSFGQWHLVTAVVNNTANTARLYVDGNDVTAGQNSTLANSSKTNHVILGMASDGFFDFDGTMDEARIEDGVRSPGWIWASWATVATNTSFAAYSPVTTTVVAPVVLHVQSTGGNVVLDWTTGILQSATNVAGPYLDINGAPNPYSVPATNAQEFFRVRQGP